MGNVYHSQGKPDLALKADQDALTIHREVGYRLGEASDLGNMGNTYARLGRVDEARVSLQQAASICAEIGATDREARVRRLLRSIEEGTLSE